MPSHEFGNAGIDTTLHMIGGARKAGHRAVGKEFGNTSSNERCRLCQLAMREPRRATVKAHGALGKKRAIVLIPTEKHDSPLARLFVAPDSCERNHDRSQLFPRYGLRSAGNPGAGESDEVEHTALG